MSSDLVSDAIDVVALDLDEAPTDPSFRTLRPHLVSPAPGVDLDAAERAAQQFLDALGVPTTSESLRGTPRRMAKAYAELFAPRPFELTTFPNDEEYDELVLARTSRCGRCASTTCCRSSASPTSATCRASASSACRKLARVVEHFACRPQVQERLTKQVADWLQRPAQPQGRGRRHRGRAHLHVAARRAGHAARARSPRLCKAWCGPTRAVGRSSWR